MRNILHERVARYTAPQECMEKGIYPYFRPLESAQDTVVVYKGRKILMFGSNSYLGLTNHPYIKEKVIEAVSRYGSGTAGSRFLNGSLDLHVELERRLAQFVGKEDAIVFSTGFQVNLGVISALVGRNDFVIVDEKVHASIIDGTRLSFGKTYKFEHNDMRSLDSLLMRLSQNGFYDSLRLIVVDGVFSMEGDVCNLPGVVAIARKYGCAVMVDDAHGIGVMGPGGTGTCAHFGLTEEVDIIMGTFSKSLATVGGFVAASKSITNYLRHHARSLIFSASISPACAAAALAALDIIEREPERIERLWKNTNLARELFHKYGFDTGKSATPIIPVYIRDPELTFLFTRYLEDAGIFVNPVVPPAVGPDECLIRFSVMATHTPEQIEYAISTMARIAEAIGLFEKVKAHKQKC